MKSNLLILAFVYLLFGSTITYGQKMDNKKLFDIIQEVADTVSGQEGYWQFTYKNSLMYMITDKNHNRMRIISPISYLKDLKESHYTEALEANFHSALDIKYAISDSIMWAVFIHPLEELSKNQTIDSIKQLYMGVITFGETYSSTNLVFPRKKED